MPRGKRKPAKPTEAQLKERLWQAALTFNWEDHTLLDNVTDDQELNFDLETFVLAKRKTQQVTVVSFVVSAEDALKMIREVEDTCLSEACKQTIKAAIKL